MNSFSEDQLEEVRKIVKTVVNVCDNMNEVNRKKHSKCLLLVNIKNYELIVKELPSDTKDKKFNYENNYFINVGKLKLR